jgi:hypothetical protein
MAGPLMAEIWKPVPSLPGVMASSEGRILLPPRYAPLPKGGYRLYAPEPYGGTDCRSRPSAAHVYRGAFNRFYGNIKIHQAVCEAFRGPKPFDAAVVIHADENGLNNRPGNLRWGTQRENMNSPGFLEYCRNRRRAA